MKNTLIVAGLVVLVGGGLWWYEKSNMSLSPGDGLLSGDYAGKKIFYLDSYHQGYEWSDGITKGIQDTLKGTGAELKVYRMDTKRNPSSEFLTEAAEKARAEIEKFKPDVLITSDDNSFKSVVMPFYKDVSLPVVFNGLNWDASIYGAPYSNTTGMVEVSLTNQIIDNLSTYASGERVGYLSADTETERKNLTFYNKLLNLNFTKTYFVKSLKEWEDAFSKLQNEVDIVIFENNAGINDWDENKAEAYTLANSKIPVGTTNPWIMKYALLGITKVPEEQGEWSAQSALAILSGKKPSDIAIVRNKRGKLYVNLKIADKLGVSFSPSIIKNAEVIK